MIQSTHSIPHGGYKPGQISRDASGNRGVPPSLITGVRTSIPPCWMVFVRSARLFRRCAPTSGFGLLRRFVAISRETNRNHPRLLFLPCLQPDRKVSSKGIGGAALQQADCKSP